MSTYAIGDIQGCYRSLQALLARCAFDPACDRLWLVGDLVNRGPRSLAVVRWARDLGERAVVVLGNHDVHLLGVAAGVRPLKKRDTFADLLAAPDAEELLSWLRSRPLLHRQGPFLLVHAGLLPSWGWDDAGFWAKKIEARLPEPALLAKRSAAGLSKSWQDLRTALGALTRVRCVTTSGELLESYKAGWRGAPEGSVPWFDHPARPPPEGTVIFGHWAALGFVMRPDIIALDSGCVWGGELTAVRLEDRQVFMQPCCD